MLNLKFKARQIVLGSKLASLAKPDFAEKMQCLRNF